MMIHVDQIVGARLKNNSFSSLLSLLNLKSSFELCDFFIKLQYCTSQNFINTGSFGYAYLVIYKNLKLLDYIL